MNVSYTVTGSESNGTQMLIVIDGKAHVVTEAHPNFEQIMERLLSKEFEGLARMVDAQAHILSQLSDNVTISGDTLYYKGEPLYTRLSNTILDFYRKGRSFTNLVNFMEKLFLNPSKHSRTQLFEFLDRHDFAITDDGDFLAYKGVQADFRSVTAGPGIVNGERVSGGYLDNTPGNLLEYDRSEVMDDPSVACAEGLHAGTWGYASSFGPVVVEVKINPADVVSVPNDSNFQKIRTERYYVLRKVDRPVNPDSRYEVILDFREWLSGLAENYTRKGKMARSYEDLATNFVLEMSEEGSPLSSQEIDALFSFVSELDIDHQANNIYRYHVEELLDGFAEEEVEEDFNWDEEDGWDEEDEDEDEDEYGEEYPEEREEHYYQF